MAFGVDWLQEDVAVHSLCQSPQHMLASLQHFDLNTARDVFALVVDVIDGVIADGASADCDRSPGSFFLRTISSCAGADSSVTLPRSQAIVCESQLPAWCGCGSGVSAGTISFSFVDGSKVCARRWG